LHVPGGDARPALERWYRRAARAEVAQRLDAAVAALDTAYTRLTIRDQRTRWGSCSAEGAIAINWRLLLGPSEVLDYVVWHEACHLVIHDHSPAFWVLLEASAGDQRQARRWLRINAMLLTL
ncbi:MAG: M48 family metallopeptidase, partial [Actinomycetota bacterium]|nr:M48 family metallopeptidase [Actinomycetota bacterium]